MSGYDDRKLAIKKEYYTVCKNNENKQNKTKIKTKQKLLKR